MKTSDKVGLVASIVLAIVVTIIILWPSLKKLISGSSTGDGTNPPPPPPTTTRSVPVDKKGIPVPGAKVGLDGSPLQVAGAANNSLQATTPAGPTPSATFYDPSEPVVIE